MLGKAKSTQSKDSKTNGGGILKIKTQHDSVKREYGIAQPNRRKQLMKAVSGRITGNAPRKEQFGEDVARKINTMEYKKKQRNKMKKKEKRASVARTLLGPGTAMMRKASTTSLSDTSSDAEPEKSDLDVFAMEAKCRPSTKASTARSKKRTVDFSHVHFREYDRPEDDTSGNDEEEDEDGEGFWYFSRESTQICVDYYERARQKKRSSKKAVTTNTSPSTGPVTKFGVPQRRAPQQYVIVWEDYVRDSTQKLETESENGSTSQKENSASSSVKSEDFDDETESDDSEDAAEAEVVEGEEDFENSLEFQESSEKLAVLC